MSDIIVALRLALRILESGFKGQDTANIRYTSFQNEIFNLHYLLQKLHEALQHAQHRYLHLQRPVGTQAYEPLSIELEDERRTLVGDFVTTLRSCDALLEQNRNCRQRYHLEPDVLRSYTSEQDLRVDYLRLQLHLHLRKIGFVMSCLSREILTTATPDAIEVSGNSSMLLENYYGSSFGISLPCQDLDTNSVPPRIASVFVKSFSTLGRTGMPLDLAFDALLTHLEQCLNGQDHAPEKYLAFLKTQWMLNSIGTSSNYQNSVPGFYFKNFVAEIKQILNVQIRLSGRITRYDDDTLLRLPGSLFDIWPQFEVPPPPPPKDNLDEVSPLDVRATEFKVLQVPLKATRKAGSEALNIFKSSEDHFRLIIETSTTSNKMFTQQTIYTREDKLIPRYCLPNPTDSNLEMAIFSRNDEALYSFSSLPDLYNFQTAFTGYDVSHDQSGIRCQFSDEAASLDCRGRIQLWQEPIAAKSGSEGSLSAGNSTIRPSSTFSESTSVFSSLAPSLATTHTVHQTEGGWEADSIKLATLNIFTELQDRKKKTRPAILSIELGFGVSIDPKECRCCRDYDSCSKLVLTKEKKSKFTANVLYADLDASGQPDTNTYDLLPFRTPRHPTFNKLVTKQTEYLVLKFPTLAEKRTFENELRLRFQVRDAQIKNQADFAKNMRRMEARPPQKQESLAPIRSLSLTPSIASVPPKIEVLDSGPNLVDAMKDVKIAEMSETRDWVSAHTDIVEVDGMRPLVELETIPKVHISQMVKHHKRNDTFAELPGAIPWFPA